MSLIEVIATIFGFLCVWFTIKENILCWPAGIIQVFLYIFVFYEARLYSDVLLHIIYFFLNIYGWYHWINNGKPEHLKVTIAGKYTSAWILVCIGGTNVLGFVWSEYTDAALPYPDSFITVASLTAQWLLTRKKLESWFFWISVDIVAIIVYWMKGLYLTTGLYVVFLVLAIVGYMEWRRSLLHTKAVLS